MNNVFFLGTGAADWPVLIDNSDKLYVGRNFRRYSSALFNDSILLDCGPSIPEALNTFNRDNSKISDILITHSHTDHLSIQALDYLVKNKPECSPMNVWGHKAALEKIACVDGLRLMPINAGDTIRLNKVHIQVLEANHIISGSKEVAFHYLFTNEGRQWLYATDGAWLLKSTWKALEQTRLDMIVWDATIGDVEGDYRIFEHNSLAMVRLMYATLKKQGIVREETRIVLTHIARTLYASHDQTEKKLIHEGLIAAYDGMCIEL